MTITFAPEALNAPRTAPSPSNSRLAQWRRTWVEQLSSRRPRWFAAVTIVLAAASVVDSLTTARALHGGADETNPVVLALMETVGVPTALVVRGLAGVLFVAVLYRCAYRLRTQLLVVVATVVTVAACLSNVRGYAELRAVNDHLGRVEAYLTVIEAQHAEVYARRDALAAGLIDEACFDAMRPWMDRTLPQRPFYVMADDPACL